MLSISRYRKVLLPGLIVLLLSAATAAHAGGPNLINYQAFLRDDMNQPLTGDVDLTFRILTLATGGDVLWTEQHNNVTVTEGVFHVVLGSQSALSETLFAVTNLWLETAVDGTPLLPRRQFLSTPYALRATVADVALNGSADEDWTIDGNDIYRASGSVGIGTTNPSGQPLDVVGDLDMGGGSSSHDGPSEFVSLRGRSALWALGIQNVAAAENSGLFIGPSANDHDFFHIQRDGRIGIGTESPSSELHIFEDQNVNSTLLVEKAGGSLAALRANVTSVSIGSLTDDDVRLVANNSVKMHIGTNGEVGIGTINTSAKLDVNGDVEATLYEARDNLGDFETPITGGVYRDNVVYAWAYIGAAGNIIDSFGIESVQWSGAGSGNYVVYFERALPNGAAVSVTPNSANDPLLGGASMPGARDRVTVRIWIVLSNGPVADDRGFYLQVVGRP